jgi:biopolymer transport protein TolQ
MEWFSRVLNVSLESGGWVIVPLGIGSLVTWALIIERLWFYLSWRTRLYSFLLETKSSILSSESQGPRELRQKFPLFASITDVFEKRADLGGLQRALQQTEQALLDGLWLLATLATTAPFMGLFGTVLGIMHAFQAMGEQQSTQFSVVSTGISEALVTTAAGIFVATIASFAYNALLTYATRLRQETKSRVETLFFESRDSL